MKKYTRVLEECYKITLLMLIILTLVIPGSSISRNPVTNIKSNTNEILSLEQASELIKIGKTFFLDVHENDDFSNTINGATPVTLSLLSCESCFKKRLQEYENLIVYSADPALCDRAVQLLREQGYTVYVLLETPIFNSFSFLFDQGQSEENSNQNVLNSGVTNENRDFRRCGTPFQNRTEQLSFRDASDCSYTYNNPLSQYQPTFYITIPVVVHIIKRNDGAGEISNALVQSQIDILNEDYQALPGTPGEDGTDIKIIFQLAGITRTINNDWFNDPCLGKEEPGPCEYSTALAWDPYHYLNIYTLDLSSHYLCGYVPFLPQYDGGIHIGQSYDRVVIDWDKFGRNAPEGPPFDQGRTATHEIGHYLGLFHPFEDGCNTHDCHSDGDLICDTPTDASYHFYCPSDPHYGCGHIEPIHNYMEYTDDTCMKEFTAQQAKRTRCTLQYYRPQLAQVHVYQGINSIQSTIDQTFDESTIFVHPGYYNENIIINKPLTLLGENRDTTTIDGNGNGDVILISRENVEISGFTIRNSGSYYYDSGVRSSTYSTIKNNIIRNNQKGITIQCPTRVIITDNNIHHNNYGIWSEMGVSCQITRNDITDNYYGISLEHLSYYYDIYHNNFIHNTAENALDNGYENQWDNGPYQGFPTNNGGNYWDDWSNNPGYPSQKYEIPPFDGPWAADNYPFENEDQWDWQPCATPDPSLSRVIITNNHISTVLANLQEITISQNQGFSHNLLLITIKDSAGIPQRHIPASNFRFFITMNKQTVVYGFDTPICTITPKESETDRNGEIRFDITSDTSLIRDITKEQQKQIDIQVMIEGVLLNDVVGLPCFKSNAIDNLVTIIRSNNPVRSNINKPIQTNDQPLVLLKDFSPLSGLVSYPKNLADLSNNAEYLVISADTFYESQALKDFVFYRATQNMFHVAVVKADDIYAAVGETIPYEEHIVSEGDTKDLQLKNFVNYVYRFWNHGAQNLKYILLVGDAYPQTAAYYLPMHLSTWTDPYGSRIPTDYLLTCLHDVTGDGYIDDNDMVGDLFIGRFSVQNKDELLTMVSKTIQFENSPSLSSNEEKLGSDFLLTHAKGQGHWFSIPNHMPFIRDTYILPSQYGVQEVYVDEYKTISEGKDALIHVLNRDNFLIAFSGHASASFWFLGDGVIFGTNDVMQLPSEDRTSVVLSMTCFTGMIDYDWGSCLGESLLNVPEKGAVAFLGATRSVMPNDGNELLDGIMNSMCTENEHVLGACIFNGKLALKGNEIVNRMNYNLYGDPALNLPH